MHRFWRLHLMAVVLVAVGWPGFGEQRPLTANSARPLTVRVYNLASVPARTLDAAIRDASRILTTAGVEAVWQRGLDEREAHTVDLIAWKDATYTLRDYIVVELLGAAPSRYFPGALGYALPHSQFGVNATIFYERIQRLNEEGGTDLATVLGHVMAHEIGHVLLGSTEHSRSGIMKATWSKTDFQISHRAAAEFTAQQYTAIQQRISIQAAGRIGR